MKRFFSFIFSIILTVNIYAQESDLDCYKGNVRDANAAYKSGKYKEAHELYKRALKCSQAKNKEYNNGKEAKDGIEKCLPVIKVNDTQRGNSITGSSTDTVGCNGEKKTYHVTYKNGTGWEIYLSAIDSTWIKIVEQDHIKNTFTLECAPNSRTSIRRSSNIHIDHKGGVETKSTHLNLFQKGIEHLLINKEEFPKYNFLWEGGVIRCDVTGVPEGQQYDVTGVDSSWIMVQKQKNCFFLFVKNNVEFKDRKTTLQVKYSSQQVNISIYQKQRTIQEAVEFETRVSKSLVPIGKLKQEKNKVVSTYPIRIKYKDNYIPGYVSSINGFIMGIGNRYHIMSGYYTIFNDIGTYRINQNCRVEIAGTRTKNEYGRFEVRNANLILYYKTNILKSMHFKDTFDGKVYVFKNGDFAIIYNIKKGEERPSRKSLEICGYDECVELWSADGRLLNITDASEIDVYEDGIAVVKKWMGYHHVARHTVKEYWKYEWEIIDRHGRVTALSPKIEMVDDISEGIIKYHITDSTLFDGRFGSWDLYGFCDMKGNIIKKAQYSWADSFREGRALVRVLETGAYEYITMAGDVLPKHTFMRARPFSEGIAAVYGNDNYGFRISFIDDIGHIKCQFDRAFGDLDMRYDNSYVFCEGVANAIKKDSDGSVKYFLINKKGEPLTEKTYDAITPIRNGIAGVKNKHCWGIISKKGNLLLSPEKYSFTDEPHWNKDGTVSLEKWCCAVTVDSEGSIFNGNVSDCMSVGNIADCDLRRFVVNGLHGYYNTQTGLITISARYDDAYDFSENTAAVKTGSKWGYINTEGIIIIPSLFEDATPFKNGYATVTIEGKQYRIDKNGVISE